MAGLNNMIDIKIMFIIFLIQIFILTFISIFIILLIIFTKNLHSPINLLHCNTSLVIILYSATIVIKTSLLYNGSTYSTWWCRILAYVNYTFLNMVYYSFVIQALSRLFLIVFHSHRHLLEYKFHIILIIFQILISSLIPLPVLITKDVTFVPLSACWVPPAKTFHTFYLFISTYFVPLFIVLIIYGVIYCRVIQSSATVQQPSHAHKREFEVIKHILILLSILITTGIPILIVIIVAITTNFQSISFYFFPFVSMPLIAIIERIYLIHLHQELWREAKKLFIELHLIHPSNDVTVAAFPVTHVPNRIQDEHRSMIE